MRVFGHTVMCVLPFLSLYPPPPQKKKKLSGAELSGAQVLGVSSFIFQYSILGTPT